MEKTKHIKTGGYSNVKLKAKHLRKADEAFIRNEAHAKLSLEQKIKKAKGRRGNSKRELDKLNILLQNKKEERKNPEKETSKKVEVSNAGKPNKRRKTKGVDKTV